MAISDLCDGKTCKKNAVGGKNRYARGYKYCAVCAVYMYSRSKSCICCDTLLRTKPKDDSNAGQQKAKESRIHRY